MWVTLSTVLTRYDFYGELLEKQVVLNGRLLFWLEGGREEKLVLVDGMASLGPGRSMHGHKNKI